MRVVRRITTWESQYTYDIQRYCDCAAGRSLKTTELQPDRDQSRYYVETKTCKSWLGLGEGIFMGLVGLPKYFISSFFNLALILIFPTPHKREDTNVDEREPMICRETGPHWHESVNDHVTNNPNFPKGNPVFFRIFGI